MEVDLKSLMSTYDDRVKNEFALLPEISDAPSGFEPWTSPIQARKWYRLDDVIAVVIDLKGSTRLSLAMKYQAATAAIYEAATGTGVHIFADFGADFVAIQGDGVVALFWGETAYERALCAGISVKTFSEKTLVPRLTSRWPKAPQTGFKVALASSRLIVKRLGVPRTDHQEPVWPGKAVNFATKAAQQTNPERLLVTDSVWRHFENNEYVTFSCDCAAPTDGLWTDEEILTIPESEPDRFGRALKSVWCDTHGAEYCNKILSGETTRPGLGDTQRSARRQAQIASVRTQHANNARNLRKQRNAARYT
jgi:class 3 adenylate cyclase